MRDTFTTLLPRYMQITAKPYSRIVQQNSLYTFIHHMGRSKEQKNRQIDRQTDRQKYKHRKNQHNNYYNYIQTATKYVQHNLHKLHKTLSKQSQN